MLLPSGNGPPAALGGRSARRNGARQWPRRFLRAVVQGFSLLDTGRGGAAGRSNTPGTGSRKTGRAPASAQSLTRHRPRSPCRPAISEVCKYFLYSRLLILFTAPSSPPLPSNYADTTCSALCSFAFFLGLKEFLMKNTARHERIARSFGVLCCSQYSTLLPRRQVSITYLSLWPLLTGPTYPALLYLHQDPLRNEDRRLFISLDKFFLN